MGDVVSSHLDESKRDMISARSGVVMAEFGRLYEQQYAVALFNNVRFDIEGGGGPQYQLLHRKIPLEDKSIFSGSLFQFLEENKKWRNRFLFIPDSYTINCYDNKSSQDRNLHPKATINCAGYKVLTSMEQYLELISGSLPGVKAKAGSSPFLKCATQFPLILWHPFARHYCFCVVTEKEQEKWHAVLQDCVRHTNDGLSEENKVQTPAFTDAVRLYRQAQGHYGTWEMMCGVPAQILSNLVMEGLLPELRELISPRLKGKLHERQRNWMLISDAVYSLAETQCQAQYEALVKKCEEARSSLEASIRTDMDQIITSKEHVTNKIRAVVLPKAEKLLKVSIQPYIGSILDALMEPTSRGFFEVRDLFFRELVDMSKNTLNEGTKETVAQHMEKVSMLAFHPVKMQSCYEKVEQLSLEGLQQRFDVSSPSVFVQRAQILMREQMDNAVYTFEQILHQSLESQGSEELTKNIQRCQDRVIKKFDYDSSSVRKRFFREALLQIFIPYMLKQLSPSCGSELPRFQELIFEDFSRFILVENIFEEVVLHSVMKDIMMAVKEAAVQRRHNLYRDSIVLSNSDPSLHLLGEKPSIDWAGEYGGAQEEAGEDGEGGESQKMRRMKQVVSIIQVEGSPVLPTESCLEVPGVNDIPEEEEDEEDGDEEENSDGTASPSCPKASENPPNLANGCISGEEDKPEGKEDVPLKLEAPAESPSSTAEKKASGTEEEPQSHQEVSEEVLPPPPKVAPEETTESPPPPHNDSGFQSPSSEGGEGEMEEAPSTVGPAPPEKLPEVIEREAPSLPEVLPEVLEAAPAPSEKLPEVLQKEAAAPPEALPEVLEEAPPSPEALPEVLEEAAPAPPEALPEVLQKEAPAPPETLPEVLQKEAPAPPEALPEVLQKEAPAPPEALPEVLEKEAPAPPEVLPEVIAKEAPSPPDALPEILEKEAPSPPEVLPEDLKEAPSPPEVLPEDLKEAPSPPEALPEVLKEAPSPPEALPEVLKEAPSPPEALPEVLKKEAPSPPEALPEVLKKEAPSPPEALPEVLKKEAPFPPEALPEVLKEAPSPPEALPEVLKEAPSPPEALPEVLKEAPSPPEALPEVLEKEAPLSPEVLPEVLEKEAPPPSGQHPEVLEK